MNYKTYITVLLIAISSTLLAQRYPHSYTQYPFLNTEINKIDFLESKNWDIFFSKTNLLWNYGNQRINIIHFGGSHIQADVWSNRMRQHFQNICPYNNSGWGMYFPFRIIGSNGSPYLKTNHIGNWKGSRNSVSNHSPPFGLMGARALLLDSISTIDFWVNKEHCSDCFFDEIEIYYYDSLKNHCIEIIGDSLESIEESNKLSKITFKLNSLTDSIRISFQKIDVEGKFELFGLRFLNQSNGICYHSIGVNGASVPSYLRCEKMDETLKEISPDLVIFSIGINDAYEPSFSKQIFKSNYDSIIEIVKHSNPNVAILFTTNNDSYYNKKEPNERVFQVREAMYELAKKHGAGVWDFFEIMGGFNSIKEWEKFGLAKKDKIHFTPNGYKLIGDLLFESLIIGYKKYIKSNG